MMQNQRQEPLAGPSKYTHHQTDSTISSSHITAGAPPTPVSPHPRPAHVQAIHDFDPSLLASTSSATSNPNMYLSFTAGEIIRVHVRDATGWWDGEISAARYDEEREKKGPRRGWFPSNYVREMGWDGSLHQRSASIAQSESTTSPRSRNQSISVAHSRQASAASHESHASSSAASRATSPKGLSMRTLPSQLQALLHPVVQSLSLLESAIHSNRKTHIQPSTACVISSIRSTLMQTDCLNKESNNLMTWSVLGKERKVILVELSRLVANAKQASGAGDNGRERTVEDEKRDMEALATAARGVFASVKRFLRVANDCGIEPVPIESELADKLNLGDEAFKPQSQSGYDSAPTRKSKTRTGSNGNSRIQETFKLKAASVGDLRAARQRASSPPPPLPLSSATSSKSQASYYRRRPSSPTVTPVSATFDSSSGSGRSSPVSFKSLDRRVLGSMDSASTHSHAISEDRSSLPGEEYLAPTPAMNRTLCPSIDIHNAIGVAEDGLLSIIAAFIGHIHSHHMGSHPSSHANLIEMTRETIDCVRELLTVVETVGRQAGIRASGPRDIEHLRIAKDNLYDVASKLVEGAETVANAPFSESGEDNYDTVKARLLHTATATLRAGTECVRLVKLCVPEDDTLSANATPRQSDQRQATPRPAHEAAMVLRDKVVTERDVNTLSGPHRKITSLGHIQKRYQDGGMGIQPTAEEDSEATEEDEEEVVADTSRDEDMTMRPIVQITKPFPGDMPEQRPSLLHTHTSPSLLQSGPRSAELFRSLSNDQAQIPRSRASSLSSPAPPSRMTHRSPSRSADLDKFTSDYDLPVVPRRNAGRHSPYLESPHNAQGPQRTPTLGAEEGSLRSSGGSDQTTPVPTTPHTFESQTHDSHMFDFLSPDATPHGPYSRLANLKVDSNATPGKVQTLPRPPGTSRSITAPLPSANSDVRFWVVAHDYDPREISFNTEGQIVGASLTVLVEKMTPHDGPVEHTFWTSFFYTFRLFTTPPRLLSAIIARYDLQPSPSMTFGERERAVWIELKVVPVRLRIYNFLKAWLDTHWRAVPDDVVLETLRQFAAEVVSRTLPAMAPRLLEAIRKRQVEPLTSDSHKLKRSSSTDKLMKAAITSAPPSQGGLPPTPVISKSLHSLLQKNPSSASVAVTEFDTLELARQLIISESKLFCLVSPEDLLQTGKKTIPELKALSTMSNQITGWVADNILNEQDAKKRAALLKFYIKLADKCLMLNNFSTMFAVLAGLNSSTVLRLKKTWEALPSKYRAIMDRLQSVIEHTKNHAAYRARLREVEGPCLPFLGLILTDITFTMDGNSDTRPSVLAPDIQLINQDKYTKLGKIAMDFVRYQEPFNFHELEAVQMFLRRALAERGSGSLDALYRKSLMLEPRQGSEKLSSAVEKPGWLGGKI